MGPATAGRRLRVTLRTIRLDAGLPLSTVSGDLGWPPARLPSIETGATAIGLGALRILLAHYRLTDTDRVDHLVALQRLARRRHWADTYRHIYPRSFLEFLRYETDARTLRCVHPRAVPGLLQTEAYARAIIQSTAPHPMSDRDVEARVKARMRRQHAILTGKRRIQVTLTEPALRRPVSTDPAVMIGQFDHLIALAQQPWLDLTVLPAGSDTGTGVGPFVILHFNSDQDPDLVYLDDAPTDTALNDNPDIVKRYQTAFTGLRACDSSDRHAATRLADIRKQTR
ncbi:DUF5753 domain-containing protein [Solwaraspora sp. WMMD1047]|uniref:DUF5753 domain-containing protein n=1 Tax=Solwaraspora sp. WMMD1047 TaxID=3016102 RepID=UPI002416E83E|nr:DUF5753 domain-containing protein [Solwaraspora sp. WMMD1047]MDG4830000.1 DUF5753 domain-containing protein [Solwaraspora sp. WMMD1047]